jgi:hypothetical protein
LKLAEQGSRERALFDQYELAKRTSEASSEFVRVAHQDLGRFPLTGRGDVNTYALFAELFKSLTAENGQAGVVLPTGIATDATTAPFFSNLVQSGRLRQLTSFENEEFIFPTVHHSYRFCLLVIARHEPNPQFAFYLRSVQDISDAERQFCLAASDISLINPNTLTAPTFRSKMDAALAKVIYGNVPVLINDAEHEAGQWNLKLTSSFHMSNDSSLFLGSGSESGRDGNKPIALYEAKMFHQFDHRWADANSSSREDNVSDSGNIEKEDVNPRYWVPASEVSERLGALSENPYLLVTRMIAAGHNERTLIASIIPYSGVGNSAAVWRIEAQTASKVACLVANLNSLITDYAARQKVGGANLNFFLIKQFPILPFSRYKEADMEFILPRVLELTYTSASIVTFAQELGYEDLPFGWDESRRATLRAELDAWYARAYGLERIQLRFVLDPKEVMGPQYPSETFRVLKDREIREFGEYRTQRLVLDAWDRMERGELHKPEPYQRPAARAAESMTIVKRSLSDQNPLFGAGPLFEGIESTSVEHPPFADPFTLPNDVWAMPTYNSISVQLQLAAILKQLSGPTSAARVRLAALYALHPSYLTPRLSGIDLKTWQRLVGDSSRISGAASVIQFIPRVNIEWRDAYTQLRGMHALLEDTPNDTWAPGSTVQDFMTEGWADGRAGFVLKAMEGMEIETSIAELPVDLQAWVRAYAA